MCPSIFSAERISDTVNVYPSDALVYCVEIAKHVIKRSPHTRHIASLLYISPIKYLTEILRIILAGALSVGGLRLKNS